MLRGTAADLGPRRWWTLPIILSGSFLAFLDFFIVNIGLPAMRDDLGASPAQLQLVIAGYGIGFSVFLVTLDLFGWSWRLIFAVNIPVGLVASP